MRSALAAYGFAADSVHAADMLSEIRADELVEAAPAGAPYVSRVYHKSARAQGASAH